MEFTNHTVTSRDGTQIGYQSIGHGSGIIFIQGSMGTIENFTQLAQELADSFTIYLVERRGRGISPKVFAEDHSIKKDVEDIDALLKTTNAKYIFGLSSGGIIALQATLELPAIRKIAIYEPPLMVDGIPNALDRFKEDMAKGNTAEALVTAMKASEMGPSFMNHMPNWLLVFLTNKLLRQEDKKAKGGGVRFWHDVAPILQFDFKIIEEINPKWQSFTNIQTEVLLLGGSKSPKYLARALDSLERDLPKSTRITLEGLDHGAAWNYHKRQNPHGNPGIVAEKLRAFFTEP
jgi:pimeloyl-ACP methyl ester carboxylesterase